MNKPNKVLTFSYDDGVSQDARLIDLLNKYGMKGTFNLNSTHLGVQGELVREGKTVTHHRFSAADVRQVYAGHEVAGHTKTHAFLPKLTEDRAVIAEVEEDRLRLSELCGTEVVGFAYPGGGINYDHRVSELIRTCTGIRYCRTTVSSHSFDPEENLYEFRPSVYHHAEWDALFRLGEDFLSLKADTRKIFSVWGHSYEFDIHDTWDRFEEFLRMMKGREDILYLTNKEALLGD